MATMEERVRTVEVCIDLLTGLLQKNEERQGQQDDLIAQNRAHQADHAERMAGMEALLAKQDSHLAKLDESLAKQDSHLAKLDESLAKQDSHLAKLDESIEEIRRDGHKTRRLIILIAKKARWLDDEDDIDADE